MSDPSPKTSPVKRPARKRSAVPETSFGVEGCFAHLDPIQERIVRTALRTACCWGPPGGFEDVRGDLERSASDYKTSVPQEIRG